MKTSICTAVFVLSLAAAARAQAPIDGQWAGETLGNGPARPVTMTLTTDGETVTGSITGVGTQPGFENGVLSAGSLTFKTEQRVNGVVHAVACTGAIGANEIRFSCVSQDGPALEFVVRRQAQR